MMLQNFLQMYRFYQCACNMVYGACYRRSKHVTFSEGKCGRQRASMTYNRGNIAMRTMLHIARVQ
jgi:hypothetical protein